MSRQSLWARQPSSTVLRLYISLNSSSTVTLAKFGDTSQLWCHAWDLGGGD